MKNIDNYKLYDKIAEKLLSGDTPKKIKTSLRCNNSDILMVLNCPKFAVKSQKSLVSSVKSFSIPALHNIQRIAFDSKSSPATSLKASQYLVDKALEFSQSGIDELSPATMTQDQLIKSLEQLQRERNARMKPVKATPMTIDNDINQEPSLEDMF